MRNLLWVLLLTGCASSIMQGYVGQTVQDVTLDYGPPAHSFDVGDGRRAFQWMQGSGGYATGYTAGNVTHATVSGGSLCAYTLYAEREGERWVITGYEPPRFACE